jgi:hypothetical protein
MRSIPLAIFKRKFFSDFVLCEESKGTYLYKEKIPITHLYFIKEGEVEVKMEISLDDLINLILLICSKTNILPEIVDKLREFTPNRKMKAEMNKKKAFKICIFGKKEALGLECFNYDIPVYFNAIVCTEKVKMYKIEHKKASSILFEEKPCFIDLKEQASTRIEMIVKRLFDIFNYKANLIEEMDKKVFKLKKTNSTNSLVASNIPGLNKTHIIETQFYKNLTNNQPQSQIKPKQSNPLLLSNLAEAIRSRNSLGFSQDLGSASSSNRFKVNSLKALSFKDTPRMTSQADDIKFKKFNEKSLKLTLSEVNKFEDQNLSNAVLPRINTMFFSSKVDTINNFFSASSSDNNTKIKSPKSSQQKPYKRLRENIVEIEKYSSENSHKKSKFSEQKHQETNENYFNLHKNSPSLNIDLVFKEKSPSKNFKHLYIIKKK